MKKRIALSLFLAAHCLPLAAQSNDQPIGCLIEADEVVELGTAVTGVIGAIEVDRGDTVRRGQVVATLRDSVERAQMDVARMRVQIEADIRAARASLVLAEDRLTRARNLNAQKFISPQALTQSEAEARVAREKLRQAQDIQKVSQRELDLAEARVAERVLRSPFDGVVTDRYLGVGERMEDKALMRIAKLDPLRVEVVLPNQLYGSVAVGAEVDITPDLPGLGTLHGTVDRVDRVIDAASNTFRARLLLPNPDYRIPAGVRCVAAFVDREAPATVKPTGMSTSGEGGLRIDTALPKRM